MSDDYFELCSERLAAYRMVALYARAYRQAVDAEDPAWERGMAEEIDVALGRVRSLENQIQIEAVA